MKRQGVFVDLSVETEEEEEEEEEKQEEKKQKLSPSQEKVLKAVLSGQNVFCTGHAGSGKSFLIQELVKELKKRKRNVVVTASTGGAAYNISSKCEGGASTLHSFAGVGTAEETIDVLLKNIQKKPLKVKGWKSVHVLIIDEISMISAELFQKYNAMAKNLRGRYSDPFGGIQLILVGDFFQLPPVFKNNGKKGEKKQPLLIQSIEFKFLFQSPLWKELRIHSIPLKENYRQSSDPEFFQLLERVKLGKMELSDFTTLSGRLIAKHPEVNKDSLTKLCPTRELAESINRKAIMGIISESHFFEADVIQYQDNGIPRLSSYKTEKSDKYPVDVNLELKIGVEVLLCCNLPETERGLYNGARGVVIGFRSSESSSEEDSEDSDEKEKKSGKLPEKFYPFVRFQHGLETLITPHSWETKLDGVVVESFIQVPLIPRYAVTIHKSQGLTLSNILVYGDFFEHGQGYVALSRAQKLSELYLDSLKMNRFVTSPEVVKFYKTNKLL